MRNSIYCMFGLFVGLHVFANEGSLKIKMKSTVPVLVDSVLHDIPLQENQMGFTVASTAIQIKNLNVSPQAAKKAMQSKKMLNMEGYPTIYVTNLVCNRSSEAAETSGVGTCIADLEIKGIRKSITATFEGSPEEFKIKFQFLLSDFGIAQKFLFFGIENKALAEVNMKRN